MRIPRLAPELLALLTVRSVLGLRGVTAPYSVVAEHKLETEQSLLLPYLVVYVSLLDITSIFGARTNFDLKFRNVLLP